MSDSCLKSLDVGTGPRPGASRCASATGAQPGLFWLGGFKSDMKGTKAVALDAWARQHGRAMIRFDYSGHGESGGDFTDGTIGRWLEESARGVRGVAAAGPQVVIGSSMGGWLALLLARELARRREPRRGQHRRPGADRAGGRFHRGADVEALPAEVKQRDRAEGRVGAAVRIFATSPISITRGLIEEGRNHLLLGGMIETGCPVRILQGVQDPDVPWQHAVELARALRARRRRAHAGQGRRPSPVAARGHRAADRRGGGVRLTGRSAKVLSARMPERGKPRTGGPAWTWRALQHQADGCASGLQRERRQPVVGIG